MSLHTRDGQTYGDSQADIRTRLAQYSAKVGYPAEHYADAVCSCSHRVFSLTLDEDQGAAVRQCVACGAEHAMGDSGEYLDAAELGQCSCLCGAESFELTVGVALYAGSDDVRWLYIGARCTECGLTGCYGDWKNEFIGFRQLLAQV
jgi:hypothetical protein